MQCFIRSLMGLESSNHNEDRCGVMPPIVRSLVGGTLFMILMAILMHLIQV